MTIVLIVATSLSLACTVAIVAALVISGRHSRDEESSEAEGESPIEREE